MLAKLIAEEEVDVRPSTNELTAAPVKSLERNASNRVRSSVVKSANKAETTVSANFFAAATVSFPPSVKSVFITKFCECDFDAKPDDL